MRKRWVGLAVLLAVAPPLAEASGAKSKPPTTSPGARAGGPDLFLGYSYTHAGEASLHGWELSGAYPFRGRLGIAADLSGHYGSFAGADLSRLSFLVGPRMTWRLSRVTPFAQLLIGVVRESTEVPRPEAAPLRESATHFGTALGGGADYRIARRWAVRGQAELVFLHAAGAWDTDPRLGLGAVYRF